MDKKIKILAISPNKTGVGYYRSINPHVFMDEKYSDQTDITILDKFDLNDPNFGKGFDIIHFHASQSVNLKEFVPFMKNLQYEGTKFVMDLDDYWYLPTYFPMYDSYNVKGKIHERIITLLELVDAATTTTDIFAKEISKHNKNVFVIPNAIDSRERQFKNETKKSNRLRVGIICGSSHEKDVELLSGLVNKLQSDMDKLQFVICGFDLNGSVPFQNPKTGKIEHRPIMPHETVWYRYENILTDKYSIIDNDYRNFLLMFDKRFEYPNAENMPYRRFWTKPVNQYATHYNNIDVLLVPLVNNKFNSCKSQLKVIESAFFNKVIIAQNVGPYKIDLKSYVNKGGTIDPTGNSLLVDEDKNHKQWYKHIKWLLNHPEERQKIADNLTNEITSKYSLSEVTKTRLEAYNKIVNNK